MFETLGHYKILDRIGAGGMGEVYRARDTRLGRTVAIKVMVADVAGDPARRDRFLREARATAALSHPNIAALYEIGEDHEQLFLVFEFVPGETLKTAIAGRPLNPRRAIDLAVQIADALADAHAEGIVHRDIKPANIMVTPKGNAKILDFGLATWTAGGSEREQAAQAATMMATAAGTALGTVAYMSPEQALGEEVDQRTDLFSLGIVLFEMLTGTLPFTGTTSTALALQIVQAPAPVPSSVNKSLPRELDGIVNTALAKSLDQRYESAATLAAELRSVAAILDVRSDSNVAGIAATGAVAPRRSVAGWIVLLLVLAALAAAGWFERGAIERVWRRTLGPAPAPVIAVIPLELAVPDASQTFFADGLTEDLITRLGQTPGLKVIGRSATRNYRGRSPRDVAHELGAAVVLTGSVRPTADTVKVSLELIDPSDGTVIWSSQYTRDMKDIFVVQAQVAGEVAQALRVKLQPTAATARAAARLVDAHAYDLYLRGRQSAADRRVGDAMRFFEQAIAADDGLVEAHAGLAEAVYLDAFYIGGLDDPRIRDRLTKAADRAYELDPDFPQSNVAMGLAAPTLKAALGYLRQAALSDPSDGDVYNLIGLQILDLAPERSIAFFRKSLQVDPRFHVNHADLAIAFLALGRSPEARQALEQLPRGPAFDGMRAGWTLMIDVTDRRLDAVASGLRSFDTEHGPPLATLGYVATLRFVGRTSDAIRQASALASRWPGFCEARAILAGLYLERGDAAAAHRLGDPIFEVVRAPDANGSAVRCATVAAAAMGDTARVGVLFDRIANDRTLLRSWSLGFNTVSGRRALAGQMYPWDRVITNPRLAAARRHLEEAYQRGRVESEQALGGLP